MPDTSVDIDALLREALDDFDAAAGSSRGIGTSSSRSSSFPLHNSCTLSTAHTPLVVSAGILSPGYTHMTSASTELLQRGGD